MGKKYSKKPPKKYGKKTAKYKKTPAKKYAMKPTKKYAKKKSAKKKSAKKGKGKPIAMQENWSNPDDPNNFLMNNTTPIFDPADLPDVEPVREQESLMYGKLPVYAAQPPKQKKIL